MNKSVKRFTFLALMLFMLLLNHNIYAQPGGVPDDPSVGGGGSGQNGAVGHPTNVPLDGGMSFFLLFGGIYGVSKKLRKK